MVEFWLWLHVLAAIIAFGPTFTFPIFGSMSAKNPQHAGFALHLQEKIFKTLLYPFAIVVLPVAGIGLILSLHLNLLDERWLISGIVLYVIAVGYSVGVQTPTGMKLSKILDAMPPGPPPEGSSGPPPEVARLVKKLKTGGMILTVLFLIIFTLMVFKPGH